MSDGEISKDNPILDSARLMRFIPRSVMVGFVDALTILAALVAIEAVTVFVAITLGTVPRGLPAEGSIAVTRTFKIAGS